MLYVLDQKEYAALVAREKLEKMKAAYDKKDAIVMALTDAMYNLPEPARSQMIAAYKEQRKNYGLDIPDHGPCAYCGSAVCENQPLFTSDYLQPGPIEAIHAACRAAYERKLTEHSHDANR